MKAVDNRFWSPVLRFWSPVLSKSHPVWRLSMASLPSDPGAAHPPRAAPPAPPPLPFPHRTLSCTPRASPAAGTVHKVGVLRWCPQQGGAPSWNTKHRHKGCRGSAGSGGQRTAAAAACMRSSRTGLRVVAARHLAQVVGGGAAAGAGYITGTQEKGRRPSPRPDVFEHGKKEGKREAKQRLRRQ